MDDTLARLETARDVLDAIRARFQLQSDSQAALLLQVERAAVSRWRTGVGTMGPKTAARAARLLGLPSEYLVVAMLADAEKEPAVRAILSETAARLAARLAGRAAVILAALLLGFSAPDQSLGDAAGHYATVDYIHYAKYAILLIALLFQPICDARPRKECISQQLDYRWQKPPCQL